MTASEYAELEQRAVAMARGQYVAFLGSCVAEASRQHTPEEVERAAAALGMRPGVVVAELEVLRSPHMTG